MFRGEVEPKSTGFTFIFDKLKYPNTFLALLIEDYFM